MGESENREKYPHKSWKHWLCKFDSTNVVTDSGERKNFGYFALIGNEPLSPSQALATYRNKDVAEKAFENIQGNRIRTSI